MKPMTFPAALRGPVRAQQSPEQLFGQINATLDQIKTRNGARLDGLEETVQNLIGNMNALESRGALNVGGSAIIPVDAEYTRTFANYFRRGEGEDSLREANATGERATIRAAMSVGSDSDGGYLAPTEWDRKINQAQVATSPMRRLAKVVSTSVGAFSTLWNTAQWGSGWVGEVAARPETTTASLSPITFASGEIYAMPAATQRILDDAAIDVEAWLTASVRIEFSRQESIAFLSGDGVNKPMGLLQYVTGGAADGSHPGGNLAVVSGNPVVDDLIDFAYSLPAPYRANSSWLMSSLTAAELSKLKDTNGNLIWRESMIVGQPATLLGRPVEIDEGMPPPTAGNIAIAFGDFNAGYLINDRIGIRVLRDPYTNKPFTLFYTTKRVGGGVLDPNAIRLLQIPV